MTTLDNVVCVLAEKISRAIRSPGDIHGIKWEDVTGAMSGLSKGEESLIRYKYLDDYTCLSSLWSSLMLETLNKNIILCVGDRSGFCHAAIWEFCNTHNCPYCNGAGVRIDQHDCEKCNGGKLRAKLIDLANISGMSERAFVKKRHRYNDIYNVLSNWETNAAVHTLKKLA